MLTDPAHPGRALIEPADLDDPALPYAGPLRTILGWAGDYLCRPHPELGRQGPVCPYARAALRRRSLYLAVCPGTEHDRVQAALRGYREWFEAFDRDPYLAFLILFPDVPADRAAELIEGAQRALKGEYVARGLMLGEFHDGPPAAPGLWNPRFRPLRSPVPLLAIRHMVRTDLPFLRADPRHLAAYRAHFDEQD